MPSAYDEKKQIIDDYVKKLDSVIVNSDATEAGRLQREIIGVYGLEIENITDQLSNYNHGFWDCKPDYIGDAIILKAKLINFKLNLQSGLYKVFAQHAGGVNVTQSVNQEASTYVNVTLDNTVSLINNFASSVLSDDDKELLIGKLAGLSAEKDKNKRWGKITSVLKWIIEKGIEVGTVALPYIVKALEE